MPFSQSILPEFDEEMKNTRKLLECVPDGKMDYKPHEKSMTLGRLASHVAELPGWAVFTLNSEVLELDSNFKPTIAATRAELLELFDKSAREGRGKIAAASDDDWAKMWSFKWEGKEMMKMPRSVVMRSTIMNHLIHHRAQLGVYLRLNEIPFPGMYGPSADDPSGGKPKPEVLVLGRRSRAGRHDALRHGVLQSFDALSRDTRDLEVRQSVLRRQCSATRPRGRDPARHPSWWPPRSWASAPGPR